MVVVSGEVDDAGTEEEEEGGKNKGEEDPIEGRIGPLWEEETEEGADEAAVKEEERGGEEQ